MKIIIPERVPSSNMVYGHNGSKKYIKKKYNELRERIQEIVYRKLGNRNLDIEDYLDRKLSISIEVHEKWITKAGEVAKRDLSNKSKFLIDSIFMALGTDDKFLWEIKMNKDHNAEEDKVIVIIKPYLK